MTQEQFERERRYCAAMAIVREMVDAGILLPGEIRWIETILARKHLPNLSLMFR